MTLISRLILTLALMAGLAPAFAQAPGPVPALPDSERRTAYTISGSTCACNVNFALYGDSTDYSAWLTVWVNGVALAQPGNWTISSPSGSLASLPRPITDAVLTFTAAQTGTVQIVGARRPRRTSQFAENRGVAARDLNQVITDITAENRELWDRQTRTAQAPPGEALNVLPPLAGRANMGACFDSSGNLTSCVSAPSGSFAAGSGIKFTGSGPTTISLASTPTISPIDYGAKCDGSTFDDVAFQNALNAAIAAGSVLQIPIGNCVLNANITNGTGLFTPTTIAGSGSSSIVTFTSGHGFAFNVQAGVYNLQNFQIACDPNSAAACLKIFHATQSSATSSVIRGIYISNSGAYGMYFQNMTQTQLINNSIVSGNAVSVGIYIDDTQTADSGGNLIQGNTLSSANFPSLYGIQMLNVGGLRLLDNAIDGYGTDIYHFNTLTSGAATGIQIQRNQVDDFITAGIWLASAGAGGIVAHVNISENTFHQANSAVAGGAGILFGQAPGNVTWALNAAVVGNTIDTHSGGAGISVSGTTNLTISGNAINDEGVTVGPAIVTAASSSACVIVGNAVSIYATHLTNTAGCTVAGNN